MAVASVTLTDSTAGSEAKVLVGFGFNCYEFRVTAGGEQIELLYAAPNFAAGTERPSGSGIPLLFPFPGRIPQAKLEWGGKTYSLPPRDAFGNAIHGFVHERPWRVIEQTAQKVVGQFQASVDDPSILSLWPADFRVTATYELRGTTLASHFRFENPDSKPLPCGFGTHPYFRLPLGAAGAADDCVVSVPVAEFWELKDMIPTGRRLPVENAAAMRAGLPFRETQFDTGFTGLHYEDDWFVSTIRDPRTGHQVQIRFDRTFPICVVYNPPHRQAICIEPYSMVPGAFKAELPQAETGLRILQPGESWETSVELRFDSKTMR